MLYAFLLFWPAAVLPVLLLVSLLQFFIPTNMALRAMMDLKHHKKHVAAALTIVVAVCVNMYGIDRTKTDPNQFLYAGLFLLCSLLLSFSHIIKEHVVRSHPQTKVIFNYKVSVAQILTFVLFTPAIMILSKVYERFTIPEL